MINFNSQIQGGVYACFFVRGPSFLLILSWKHFKYIIALQVCAFFLFVLS